MLNVRVTYHGYGNYCDLSFINTGTLSTPINTWPIFNDIWYEIPD